MTGTFLLTGKILDKSKDPVASARLVLASSASVLRDPVTNEVYAPPPRVTTDAAGILYVVDGDGVLADTPGVPLVVGVQYMLRGVNRQLIGQLVFTAPDAGTTLDIADIISEPPAADPSWSDLLAALRDDFELIAGQTFVESPAGPGLFIVTEGGNDRLIPTVADDSLYVLAADPTAQDQFITRNATTGHLPTLVEDRISALASGLDGGGLVAANNLSDLPSASTARTNLGLGTAATQASSAFQSADSDLTAIAALTTTTIGRSLLAGADAPALRTILALGTAATSASTDFQPVDSDLTAIAALTTTTFGRSLLALADAAAGRTALGLGTIATGATSDYLAAANNLSDVVSANVARTNLGLGSAATQSSSAFQPTDSDLTAIAALTTTTYGRSLLTQADAAATRTTLGLGTAATSASTAFDAAGAAAAAQAASQPLDSDLTAIAALATTSYGRAFLALADAAAARTALALGTSATVDLDTDATMAAQSNTRIPSQKAVSDFTTGLTSELEDELALHAGNISNPHAVTKTQVGLGSVDNTSDTAKPVSTAQQTALNLKANLASPTFTGTVAGISKSMVGLGSVDNIADTAKPVSTAQQTALDLKANLASPTFTGTVSGITKSMVGLGSVDNTADTAKPVSTAQQAALDLKANLAGSWSAMTLGNTGTAFTTASGCEAISARLESSGVVRFKGATGGGTLTAGSFASGATSFTAPATVFFTLPVGMRPSARRVIRDAGVSNAATEVFVVETNGDVWPAANNITVAALVNFDGASFTI